MPFAVFRRHQKKLLAIFAILAMFGFVLADSLPNLLGLRGGPSPLNDNTEVAKLFGKVVRAKDLARMRVERGRVNNFMYQLMSRFDPRFGPSYFGGTSDRDLVDALIFEHEADSLGLPATPDVAKRWLRLRTNNLLTSDLFDRIYREYFSDQITDEGLLSELANQIRLLDIRVLPSVPEVTPLDVFQAYRNQEERVSAFAVPFAVAEYASKVPAPTEPELQAFYDQYKNHLPVPDSDTPGFMIPRRAQFEYASLDGAAISAAIKPKLTDKELRDYYDKHKSEFIVPPPELPQNVFAGDPDAKLTPPLIEPFVQVRSAVESTLAEERAREEIDRKFEEVKEQVMQPFFDRYDKVVEANREAQDQHKALAALPKPDGLIAPVAKRLGMTHQITPLLNRAEAERYTPIADSHVGTSAGVDGRKFADEFFDPKRIVYESIELADERGGRYLVWKLADLPARVPPLDEIRDQVVQAWKLAKARPLAEKDAAAFAESLRKAGGGALVKTMAGKRTVINTLPVPKMQPSPLLGQFNFGPPKPSEIIEIPDAGPALRNAYFDLTDKSVAVEPNQPKTIYYVLSLSLRIKADFERLYSTFGPSLSLQGEARMEAMTRRDDTWIKTLRAQAGLSPDWVPPDEAKKQERSEG